MSQKSRLSTRNFCNEFTVYVCLFERLYFPYSCQSGLFFSLNTETTFSLSVQQWRDTVFSGTFHRCQMMDTPGLQRLEPMPQCRTDGMKHFTCMICLPSVFASHNPLCMSSNPLLPGIHSSLIKSLYLLHFLLYSNSFAFRPLSIFGLFLYSVFSSVTCLSPLNLFLNFVSLSVVFLHLGLVLSEGETPNFASKRWRTEPYYCAANAVFGSEYPPV